jgi:hypothetical protein
MAATMAPAPRGKTNVHDVRITLTGKSQGYVYCSPPKERPLFLLFSKHTHELFRLQKDPQSMCIADHHHHHTTDPTEVWTLDRKFATQMLYHWAENKKEETEKFSQRFYNVSSKYTKNFLLGLYDGWRTQREAFSKSAPSWLRVPWFMRPLFWERPAPQTLPYT